MHWQVFSPAAAHIGWVQRLWKGRVEDEICKCKANLGSDFVLGTVGAVEDAGQGHWLSHRHLLELVPQLPTLRLLSDPTPRPQGRSLARGLA